ncbi:Ubiquinone biosynthesis O-methyltransferase, mitochondrial [Halotydeus destructor]|nr:Ubiquinone biosynthesis O-methyltransferase, mitochondrial [Halotydeus destructor]
MAFTGRVLQYSLKSFNLRPNSFKLVGAIFSRPVSSGQDGKKQSTVDPADSAMFAERFNYDTWWTSQDGAALRQMNELRVPLIRDNLVDDIKNEMPLHGFKILDVGSGGGVLSEPLARLGANVIGVEPVQSNVQAAQRHLDEVSTDLKNSLTYNNTTIEEFSSISSNQSAYDAVVVSEVLEHVSDVELFLTCVRKVLKPQGKLFITTINQTTSSYLLAILVAENVLGLLPKGTHTYEKLVPLNGLQLMLRKLDFNVDIVHGMCYNVITGRWNWIGNTRVNYALVASRQD